VSDIPITLKTRVGYDQGKPVVKERLLAHIYNWGASALTRTSSLFHSPPSPSSPFMHALCQCMDGIGVSAIGISQTGHTLQSAPERSLLNCSSSAMATSSNGKVHRALSISSFSLSRALISYHLQKRCIIGSTMEWTRS